MSSRPSLVLFLWLTIRLLAREATLSPSIATSKQVADRGAAVLEIRGDWAEPSGRVSIVVTLGVRGEFQLVALAALVALIGFPRRSLNFPLVGVVLSRHHRDRDWLAKVAPRRRRRPEYRDWRRMQGLPIAKNVAWSGVR